MATSSWPQTVKYDAKQAQAFAEIQQIVVEARAISSAVKQSRLRLWHTGQPFIEQYGGLITQLARLGGAEAVVEEQQGQGIRLVQSTYDLWLNVDSKALKRHLNELGEQKQTQQGVVKQLEGRLANKAYVANAPAAVVDQTKDQLAKARDLLASIVAELERFSSSKS